MDFLCVVMPVYNEEDAILAVIEEWVHRLRQITESFQILVVNDGSNDGTLNKLQDFATKVPELKIHSHTNRGHGLSCLEGYRLALENNAEWIFQIDSDGQCDPKYFSKFWDLKGKHKIIMGSRYWRQDGLQRWLVSWALCLLVFSKSKKWIRDPNVPYRLMHASVLKSVLPSVPPDIYLSNIALSISLAETPIKWVPIVFRKRLAGQPKLNFKNLLKHGLQLNRQLK